MSRKQDIRLEKKRRCGLVTLDRLQALNALGYDMIAKMESKYIEWAGDPDIYGVVLQSAGGRAFCSGGDLKALYRWRRAGKLETILEKYTGEYQHNYTLDRFTKPHVALMDGYVFGSGVGISLYGTHKVAGRKYRFAMPETGIGFFPDVGATYFMTRMPGRLGLYLALTGEQIDRADAYALGLLTHCIDAREFPAIVKAMTAADPIDPVLDSRHADPGPSQLLEMQGRIDRYFAGESVEEILDALDGAPKADSQWARKTARTIRKRSPLALKVTFRQMRKCGRPALGEALELEARIARAFLSGDELYEGIRALLIDKDGKPKWSPRKIEDVSEEMVDQYFPPAGEAGFRVVNPFAEI